MRMIFLSPRWDMLIPWRVHSLLRWRNLFTTAKIKPCFFGCTNLTVKRLPCGFLPGQKKIYLAQWGPEARKIQPASIQGCEVHVSFLGGWTKHHRLSCSKWSYFFFKSTCLLTGICVRGSTRCTISSCGMKKKQSSVISLVGYVHRKRWYFMGCSFQVFHGSSYGKVGTFFFWGGGWLLEMEVEPPALGIYIRLISWGLCRLKKGGLYRWYYPSYLHQPNQNSIPLNADMSIIITIVNCQCQFWYTPWN